MSSRLQRCLPNVSQRFNLKPFLLFLFIHVILFPWLWWFAVNYLEQLPACLCLVVRKYLITKLVHELVKTQVYLRIELKLYTCISAMFDVFSRFAASKRNRAINNSFLILAFLICVTKLSKVDLKKFWEETTKNSPKIVSQTFCTCIVAKKQIEWVKQTAKSPYHSPSPEWKP